MTDPVVVVGGGLVGAAIANGLSDADREIVLLDEGDFALHASLGNAGLIWVQGKGDGAPPYAAWTRRSAALWPGLSEMLRDEAGIDVEYTRPGGFHLCLSEAEAETRTALPWPSVCSSPNCQSAPRN
jgi:glycine/D-amino acid oxidase-like deaminating enzyme